MTPVPLNNAAPADPTIVCMTDKEIASTAKNVLEVSSFALAPGAAMAGLERLSATQVGYWLNHGQHFRMGVSEKGANYVYRVAGDVLGKVPEPVRDFLGIRFVGNQWKWDIWTVGPRP